MVGLSVRPTDKFNAFCDSYRFGWCLEPHSPGNLIEGFCARYRNFKLRRQVMCIDEIKDDIFELGKTPADLEARIVVKRWQLGNKTLDTLMDLP